MFKITLQKYSLYFCSIILNTAFGLLSSHKQVLKRITGSLASLKSVLRVLICFPGFKTDYILFLSICKLYEKLGHGKESMGDPENVSSHKLPRSHDFNRKKKRSITCNQMQTLSKEHKFEKFPSEDDTKTVSKPNKPQITLQFPIILDDTNCLIFGSGIKITL